MHVTSCCYATNIVLRSVKEENHLINSIALRKAKNVCNFGHVECNRVKFT